ncbi:MAG: hypothetical protein GY753_06910 [Gammaproteobacteria bacterium]|nr:hypothetical protein [Gammaproteobacteria bacterium]
MDRALLGVSASLDSIREAVGGDLETQGAALLLQVMCHDPHPLLVKELVVLVGVSHGSIVRYLRLLGNEGGHPRGGECADLVQSVTDPTDKRRMLITLSPKGRRLKAEITHWFNPTFAFGTQRSNQPENTQ